MVWFVLLWAGMGLVGCRGEGSGDTGDGTKPTSPISPSSPTPTDPQTTGPDGDGDGFGVLVDCDDADASVYPGAPDVCGDGRVTDCDRSADTELVTLRGEGYDDLQAALDAAEAGDELLLCPGTYIGAFTAAAPVRLVAFEDAQTTILDAEGAGTVLSVPGGSEIVGLTVRGGAALEGGGLRMTSGGSLLLEGCTVSDNEANRAGGLFVAADATAVLVDSVVSDNRAVAAGGALVSAGGTLDLIAGGVIEDNHAQQAGGGVWLDGGALVGGRVSGNHQPEYAYPSFYRDGLLSLSDEPYGGAGVATTGDVTLDSVEISGNRGAIGVGLSISGGTVTAADCDIHGNGIPYGWLGGGLMAVGAEVSLEGSTVIRDNKAAEQGAGMAVAFSTITGGTVSGNFYAEEGGGAIVYQGTLRRQVIADNRGELGGGVFAIGQVILDELTLSGNTAEWGGGLGSDDLWGGYFYDYTPTEVTLTNSTVTGNTAERGGGLHSGRSLDVTDTVVTDNVADEGAGLYVQAGQTTVTGGAFLRNQADFGGGALVESGSLSCEAVDFGVEADDNTPSDVQAGGVEHDYGEDATFACTTEGCSP